MYNNKHNVIFLSVLKFCRVVLQVPRDKSLEPLHNVSFLLVVIMWEENCSWILFTFAPESFWKTTGVSSHQWAFCTRAFFVKASIRAFSSKPVEIALSTLWAWFIFICGGSIVWGQWLRKWFLRPQPLYLLPHSEHLHLMKTCSSQQHLHCFNPSACCCL